MDSNTAANLVSMEMIDMKLHNGTENDMWNQSNISMSPRGGPSPASPEAVAGLSVLFCVVGFIGLVGNFLVIYVILRDRTMRTSVTNLFIMNLGIADFLVMVCGIPDIVQFMMNRGWLIGVVLCKVNRYIMVVSLYASIMTLMSVCVERYVAIVHPIKAHILCTRRRISLIISFIWPIALLYGLPTVLFNTVTYPGKNVPHEFCIMRFPGGPIKGRAYQKTYKVIESILFFLIPVIVQIVLYTIMSKHLFLGTETLHRRKAQLVKDGGQKEKDSDAIKARKGVVKMLIASVLVYVISYTPVQIPLFYNTIGGNWSFHVLVMTLGFINSAANPILYSIFSRKFRTKFALLLCKCCGHYGYLPAATTENSTAVTKATMVPYGRSQNNKARTGNYSNFTENTMISKM